MIIKDGLMDLLVQDTDVALDRVTQLAADQGGYIVSSRVWMENGYKHAELRMGVPSMTFEDTLNRLRRLAIEVLNEQASGRMSAPSTTTCSLAWSTWRPPPPVCASS